jgi:hypothetical protein
VNAVHRARDFWHRAGGVPVGFPRDIERAVALALPVAVVKLPRVTVTEVSGWLGARGVSVAVPPNSYELAGCVVAHRGRALAFVCGADPEDELRVTVAHEASHVIVHYLDPRAAAVRAIGPGVIDVLDGLREATTAERVTAVIASVRVGPHVHLLPRGERRRIAAVSTAEEEADELALELLAPRHAVGRMLQTLENNQTMATPEGRRAALAERFGVPAMWFRQFVPDRPACQGATFTDHLFSSLRRQP